MLNCYGKRLNRILDFLGSLFLPLEFDDYPTRLHLQVFIFNAQHMKWSDHAGEQYSANLTVQLAVKVFASHGSGVFRHHIAVVTAKQCSILSALSSRQLSPVSSVSNSYQKSLLSSCFICPLISLSCPAPQSLTSTALKICKHLSYIQPVLLRCYFLLLFGRTCRCRSVI